MVYVNRVNIDPVAHAAISHAQFEITHPFADGNGRVGRVLVAWLLTRQLALLVPPPVSVAIAADVARYASGLVLFRRGDHRRWVRWFADAVANGARAQRTLIAQVDGIKRRWHDELIASARRPRSDAAVFATLDLPPRHPVFTSPVLAEEPGISRKAALAALHRLAAAGILEGHATRTRGAPGQPAALFVSR